MSFAIPSAFVLAVFALPIIVFYILKVRLRRIPVSTNLFWNQIYDEKPPRSIWQYLRHLISLLVQLLMLSLLVTSVADPYMPWQLLQARRIVAVIDNSASMEADDVSPSRFDAAIDSAVAIVEGMRFRDEMAIVLAGPRPEVILGMSGHVPTLKRALQELKVSHNPTELDTAIELGKRLISNHPRGQVIVFSDGCEKFLDEPVTAADPTVVSSESSVELSESDSEQSTEESLVEYRIFAAESANVGITQFQVRRSLMDPLGYELLVAVHNASSETLKCRLEIEMSEVPVDIVPLELQPEETWSRSLEKTSLEGGQIVAKLTRIERSDETETADDPDSVRELNGLEADDAAWAILPPREIQNVLIVSPGNLFLRKVFEANPLVRVTVRTDFPQQWPTDELIVLHGEVPEQIPTGNIFVVDPTNGCDLWELGEMLQDPIVTEQDEESQLMKHVRLDNVLVPEAKQITIPGANHVLAGALSGDPIYVEVKRDVGKCLVLSVNLDRSDLAFRTAFPIMVSNALGWFSGTSGELRESVPTGQVASFQPETEPNGTLLTLASPSSVETAISYGQFSANADEKADVNPVKTRNASSLDLESAVSLGPLDECGIWTLNDVSSNDKNVNVAIAEFAVNLANARETDLRPPNEMLSESKTELPGASWFARPFWYYFVAMAGVLLIAEWFLYQRRVLS